MTHILIVEDEISFSEALAFLLEKEGFQVTVAENGREAIEKFDAHGADLILLDLMIPEISASPCSLPQIEKNSSFFII